MFDEALNRLYALGNSAAAILPGLLLGLLVFGIRLLVARAVREGVPRAAQLREASADVAAVLGRIAGGLVTLMAFLIAASVTFPSVSAADLFNLLGIGGVAIGFAFRDVLQNLLAGILILLTRPFRIGDQIRDAEHEGTVEDIWVLDNCPTSERDVVAVADCQRKFQPPVSYAVITSILVVNSVALGIRMRWLS